jgi:hypothetical protein
MTLSSSLQARRASSSVGGRPARRRGARRQDQFRVVDDIADIFVVTDEADPAVRLLYPHQIAGLHRSSILVDRDHLAAVEPGGGEPYRGGTVKGMDRHCQELSPRFAENENVIPWQTPATADVSHWPTASDIPFQLWVRMMPPSWGIAKCQRFEPSVVSTLDRRHNRTVVGEFGDILR